MMNSLSDDADLGSPVVPLTANAPACDSSPLLPLPDLPDGDWLECNNNLPRADWTLDDLQDYGQPETPWSFDQKSLVQSFAEVDPAASLDGVIPPEVDDAGSNGDFGARCFDSAADHGLDEVTNVPSLFTPAAPKSEDIEGFVGLGTKNMSVGWARVSDSDDDNDNASLGGSSIDDFSDDEEAGAAVGCSKGRDEYATGPYRMMSDADEDEKYASSSDEETSDDEDATHGYCRNCTASLYSSICPDCKHDAADDIKLVPLQRVEAQADTSGRALKPTVLAYDEVMAAHGKREGLGRKPHPERPDRILAVINRLLSSGLAGRCRRINCRAASRSEIERCHRPELFDAIAGMSGEAPYAADTYVKRRPFVEPDTYINESTFSCASLAAGSCAEVAAAVVRGEAPSGAAIVRPPGHHAESGNAMGFCIFNNAAVAARAAQDNGARRVLIVDWDVHHGNGTQHIFDDDPSVLYMSLHRHDGGHFYPGSGAAEEVGRGSGEGYTVNVPWQGGGVGNGDYLAAFNYVLIPIAYEFAPDIVIVSAGFDAAAGDPIGGCELTSEAFAHMTSMLAAVAPLVLLLEGGYNLAATASGVEASLRVLLGERPPRLPFTVPSPACMHVIQEVIEVQSQYWHCLRGLVRLPVVFQPPAPILMPRGPQELVRPFSTTAAQPCLKASIGVPPISEPERIFGKQPPASNLSDETPGETDLGDTDESPDSPGSSSPEDTSSGQEQEEASEDCEDSAESEHQGLTPAADPGNAASIPGSSPGKAPLSGSKRRREGEEGKGGSKANPLADPQEALEEPCRKRVGFNLLCDAARSESSTLPSAAAAAAVPTGVWRSSPEAGSVGFGASCEGSRDGSEWKVDAGVEIQELARVLKAKGTNCESVIKSGSVWNGVKEEAWDGRVRVDVSDE